LKDLGLTDDGDLACSELGVTLVDGAARVAQQVRTRLRTWLGEWEFDLDAGVPWLQRILAIKGVNLADVDNVLRDEILDVADVSGILEFSMTFDKEARNMEIRAKISTTFGAVAVEGAFP
jgi:hypothetical protein